MATEPQFITLDLVGVIPCPTCGAGVNVPCRTRNGKPARQPHEPRLAEWTDPDA